MKLAAIIAAVALMMSPLCSCSRESLPAVPSSSAVSSLSEDESKALLTFYDSLPEQLSSRQMELVEAYRALRQYLADQYPDAQWEVVLLEPAGPLNGGGNSYETFHLLVNGSKVKFQVKKNDSGTWQVLNDPLSQG